MPSTFLSSAITPHSSQSYHPRKTNHYTEAAQLVERLMEEVLALRPKDSRPTLRYVAR